MGVPFSSLGKAGAEEIYTGAAGPPKSPRKWPFRVSAPLTSAKRAIFKCNILFWIEPSLFLLKLQKRVCNWNKIKQI